MSAWILISLFKESQFNKQRCGGCLYLSRLEKLCQGNLATSCSSGVNGSRNLFLEFLGTKETKTDFLVDFYLAYLRWSSIKFFYNKLQQDLNQYQSSITQGQDPVWSIPTESVKQLCVTTTICKIYVIPSMDSPPLS